MNKVVLKNEETLKAIIYTDLKKLRIYFSTDTTATTDAVEISSHRPSM